MQMLCHKPLPLAALQRGWLAITRAAALCLALALGGAQAIAQTAGEAPLSQDSLFKEVGNWMQQNQQLSAGQFDFVPLDSRVKVQPCDRPLVMDLPFSTKETVRVRCLGASSWQLYLRANIKAPQAKPATAVAPPNAAAAPPASATATPPKSVGIPASPRRKVVIGTQFLRAGTVLNASMLEETEQAAAGLDNSLFGGVKDLENAEVVRDIPAGTALRSSDVRRALMVKQGQLVMLTISQGSSFAIVARVEALQRDRTLPRVCDLHPEVFQIWYSSFLPTGRFLQGQAVKVLLNL
jgi:flagellar basal body P-ring formation protein FlgA